MKPGDRPVDSMDAPQIWEDRPYQGGFGSPGGITVPAHAQSSPLSLAGVALPENALAKAGPTGQQLNSELVSKYLQF